MFDIGFLELLVIAVLGLLVLGPERLPGVIKKFASWTARSRHFANSLKEEFEREANLSEMRLAMEKKKKEFQSQVNEIEEGYKKEVTHLTEEVKEKKKAPKEASS
jgi:sec-independent protein translocase protein TatB